MKKSLRRLTIAPLLGLATAALLAGGGWYALNRKAPTPVETSENAAPATKPKATVSLASDAKNRDSAGNSMLGDAIIVLDRHEQITAEVVINAEIGGKQLLGEGNYYQQGRGDQRRIKWSVRADVLDSQASLTQSLDNRFLWIDQRFPSKRLVERVDLWSLRRQFKVKDSELQSMIPGQATVLTGVPNFGGLPMLLESLARNFDFAAPRLFSLAGEEVYLLNGVWKSERLRELLTATTPETNTSAMIEIPPRFPLNVVLLIGCRDYFPFLVEYRSADDPVLLVKPELGESYQLSWQPLMKLSLSRVDFATPIPPDKFDFSRNVDWVDATPRYAERIRRDREKLSETIKRKLAIR